MITGGRERPSPAQEHRSAARQARPRALTALALLLMWAEPLGLAFFASSILTRIIDRGPWAVLLMSVRLGITAVGIGAGLALWHRRPGAVAFARVAVALTAAGVILTFASPVFPHNRPPGTTAPLLTALLIYYAAWFAYLTWMRTRP